MSAMAGASISVDGLTHRYRSSAKALTVLDQVSLEVPAGGYVAITGPSGAGKSTLLAVLGGLEAPQEGTVVVDGQDLHDRSRSQLASYRRSTVGFVFQHFGLLDALTAAENVALACALARVRPAEAKARARTLLGAVGLADRLDHQPGALSGGERQRVAIARALANEPRLVLADEPTGNLDTDSAALVVDLLETLPTEQGCTLVVVTHDRALAARADRRFDLVDGRIAERVHP